MAIGTKFVFNGVQYPTPVPVGVQYTLTPGTLPASHKLFVHNSPNSLCFKAIALIFEASIHQSAGSDIDALLTLLRVDEAVDSIHRDDCFLRDGLLAIVLSEMG